MALGFWNKDPVERLSDRFSKIETAFEKLTKKTRHRPGADLSRTDPFGSFKIPLKDVRVCIRRMRHRSKRSERIDPLDVTLLKIAHSDLLTGLKTVGELRNPRGAPLFNNPLFVKVQNEVRELGNDIRLVVDEETKQDEAEMERNPYYKTPRILREAIKRKDSRLGRKLTLSGLDSWVVKFEGIDWQDEKMIDRVASIFILSHIAGQTWEIRRGSKTRGRSYEFVMHLPLLPGPEVLILNDLGPGDYYIAAKLPSWRIVWKFEWFDRMN